jgi:hypothetical protein
MSQPDFLNPKEVLQNILEIIHCPFCGSDYSEKYTRIKAQVNRDYIVQLICPECQNSIMANFSYQGGKRFSKNKIDIRKNDMPSNEMMRFISRGAISDDDVIDLHKEMKDFDGDFKGLFNVK